MGNSETRCCTETSSAKGEQDKPLTKNSNAATGKRRSVTFTTAATNSVAVEEIGRASGQGNSVSLCETNVDLIKGVNDHIKFPRVAELAAVQDPRSPSQGILRTPLLCAEEKDSQDGASQQKQTENLFETPKKPPRNRLISNPQNPEVSKEKDLPDIFDPRSPSSGISRTPVAKLESSPSASNGPSSYAARNTHDPRSPTTDVARTPIGVLFGHSNLRRTVLMTNALMASPTNKQSSSNEKTTADNKSNASNLGSEDFCDPNLTPEGTGNVDSVLDKLNCSPGFLNMSCSSSMIASIGSEVDDISVRSDKSFDDGVDAGLPIDDEENATQTENYVTSLNGNNPEFFWDEPLEGDGIDRSIASKICEKSGEKQASDDGVADKLLTMAVYCEDEDLDDDDEFEDATSEFVGKGPNPATSDDMVKQTTIDEICETILHAVQGAVDNEPSKFDGETAANAVTRTTDDGEVVADAEANFKEEIVSSDDPNGVDYVNYGHHKQNGDSDGDSFEVIESQELDKPETAAGDNSSNSLPRQSQPDKEGEEPSVSLPHSSVDITMGQPGVEKENNLEPEAANDNSSIPLPPQSQTEEEGEKPCISLQPESVSISVGQPEIENEENHEKLCTNNPEVTSALPVATCIASENSQISDENQLNDTPVILDDMVMPQPIADGISQVEATCDDDFNVCTTDEKLIETTEANAMDNDQVDAKSEMKGSAVDEVSQLTDPSIDAFSGPNSAYDTPHTPVIGTDKSLKEVIELDTDNVAELLDDIASLKMKTVQQAEHENKSGTAELAQENQPDLISADVRSVQTDSEIETTDQENAGTDEPEQENQPDLIADVPAAETIEEPLDGTKVKASAALKKHSRSLRRPTAVPQRRKLPSVTKQGKETPRNDNSPSEVAQNRPKLGEARQEKAHETKSQKMRVPRKLSAIKLDGKIATPITRAPLALLANENSPTSADDQKFQLRQSPVKTRRSTKLPRYQGTPPIVKNRSLSVSFSGSPKKRSRSLDKPGASARSFSQDKEN